MHHYKDWILHHRSAQHGLDLLGQRRRVRVFEAMIRRTLHDSVQRGRVGMRCEVRPTKPRMPGL